MQVRQANEADVDAIVAMTRAQRRRLAEWSPVYFSPSVDADEIHARYLAFIVSSPEHDVRVAEDGDVVGVGVVNPQPNQWFLDDVCVRDDRWPDVGAALIDSVSKRPSLTCVSPHDEGRRVAFEGRGYVHVSSYFSRLLEPSENEGPTDTARPPSLVAVEPNPPHTFGGSIDPDSEGALVINAADGYVVGSPSITPPIYDPGGPSCVIDRVHGRDSGRLLELAGAATAQRGDRQLIVVVASADTQLLDVLGAHGFEPQILVYGRED